MTANARAFLIAAAVGFILAVVLGVLVRYASIGAPDWIVYIWPTFLVLGGISGYASTSAEVTAIGISAFLNAVLYGVIGWLCFRLVSLFGRK